MVRYELPPLGYEYDDLEPYIDAQTMEIHHSRHHKAYTDGLNSVLDSIDGQFHPTYISAILSDLHLVPESARRKVNFFGGGYENHRLFWEMMSPNGGGTPGGKIGDAIDVYFGSFEKFKEEFSAKTAAIQGSGWGWLVYDDNFKRLEFLGTQDQTSPWTKNRRPILGLDVWEHAYYLKYQNKRADYIDAWWNVVNWDSIDYQFSEIST